MDEISNNLRTELYKLLMPKIIQEDLSAGVDSYINFWDDPLLKWDEGHLWDEIGILPVLKNVFFAIETEEDKDLEWLESFSDLIDPDRCPESFLETLSYSLGHNLEERLDEKTKREVIKSIIDLHKTRGRELSWEVFYKLLGFTIKATPLWKKNIFEENEQYHTEQYKATLVKDESLGVAGGQNYVGLLSQAPVKPGTIRVRTGDEILRDDGDRISDTFGKFLSTGSGTGTINYATGEYKISLTAPAPLDPVADYELVTEEFPYRAARVDLEFFILLDDGTQLPFDETVLNRILKRLEQVRPIHVLVRLFVVVLDIPDVIPATVTDSVCCGPTMAKDVRDDEYRFYAADVAPAAGDTEFHIEKDYTVSLDHELLIQEETKLRTNLDVLTIDFSDGQPTQYW